MTLKVELKHGLSSEEKQKLAGELSQKLQNICRIKPDRIEFVPHGTLSEEQPKIVDERSWE
jgi:hypothetical protein